MNKPLFGSMKLDERPPYGVGHVINCGTPNRYDILAGRIGISSKAFIDCEYPVESGLFSLGVDNVEKRFKPIEGSGIHSWLSNKDYSDNPNFEAYWEVGYNYIYTFYDMTDFLEFALKNVQ